MKKIFLSAILFLLLTHLVSAQTINYAEYKNKYPESEYVVLENKSELKYYLEPGSTTLKAKLSCTESIMLLSDKSTRIDLIQIPYSTYEDATITSAKYFMLDSLNKKTLVENVKVKYAESKNYYINNIFYSDLKVKQFACTFPTKEKYILTYSYEKTYHDLKFLTTLQIQDDNANVELFELTIKSPKLNSVDYLLKPINLTYNDFAIQESSTTTESVSKIKLTNILSKKVHALSPPQNYFLPHFIVLTKSYKVSDRKYTLLETTDDQYKWYNSLIKELPPVDPKVTALANTVSANAKTDEEIIESIFKWVQQNVNYVAFEDGIAGFKPDLSVNVSQNKFGDCKGMANLLVDMLRAKNIKAYHTWVGTRHLNYTYDVPSLCIDNHMICAVLLGERYYFLDATSKTTSWRNPPNHIQGKQALVGINDEYKIIKIPVTDGKANTIEINSEINLTQPTRPVASGTIKYSGEYQEDIQSLEIYTSKQKLNTIPERLVRNHLSILTNPTVTAFNKTPKEYSVNFKSSNLTNIGLSTNQMYVSLDADRSFYSQATYKSTNPVYIENTQTITSVLKYILPATAKVMNAPQDINYAAADGSYSINIKHTISGNTILYNKTIYINTLLVNGTKEWNEFISMIDKTYDQLLIIKLN